MTQHTERLQAADLMTAIKSAGIRFIIALPDRTTSEHLLKPFLEDPDMHVVQICKEDEGVSICSGLYAAGQRALLLMAVYRFAGFHQCPAWCSHGGAKPGMHDGRLVA